MRGCNHHNHQPLRLALLFMMLSVDAIVLARQDCPWVKTFQPGPWLGQIYIYTKPGSDKLTIQWVLV